MLLVAIVLESFSLRTAVKEASSHLRGGRAGGTFVRHAKAPELPVVLLEDTGALVGLVLALLGVTLAVVTGNGRWDGLGSLAIGLLLVAIAVFLAVEMNSLLIGESATPERRGRDQGGAGGRRRRRTGHPPAHPAPRAGGAAGRRRRSPSRTTTPRPRSRGRSTPPRHGCAPPSRSPRVIYLEPDIDRSP